MELTTTKKIRSLSELKFIRTEIGLIPADWKVGLLKDKVIKVGSGITPRGGEKIYKSEGRPFIRSQNVGWGELRLDDIAYIDENTHKTFDSTEIQKDDVLLNITGASIGRSAIADERVVKGNVNQHVCIIRTKQNELNPYYLNYLLLSRIGQDQIDSFQSGGNRQGLNLGQIKIFNIPIPPTTTEQAKIAQVLSDIDTLLALQENLSAKKRNIKTGIMQLFLSGNKRLPGFKGLWEVKKLSSVSWFQEGPGVRASQFTQSGIKLLNGTNIWKGKLLLDSTNRYISIEEANGPYSHFLIDPGDIVIASSGITIDKFEEKVSFVSKEHLPLCMNTSTIRFKIRNNSFDSKFLYYFLMSKQFKDQIGTKATGSAQLNFGPSHLEMVEIFMPKDKKEQTAIATILSDIDAEIEMIEGNLNKLKFIKQGMMQLLLRGKIRLT